MAHQVHQVNTKCLMAARLEVAFEAWHSIDTARTIYIGDLPESTCKDELMHEMSVYGRVQKLVIAKDPKTKKAKGYGKVVYLHPEAANAALAAQTGYIGGIPFKINGWIDPLTYIEERNLKAFRKVYVKHKSVHTKENLLDYFQRFGQVEEIDMRFNFKSNRSRHFCYIVFRNERTAKTVASSLHKLMGQELFCEMCRPADPLSTMTVMPSNNNMDRDSEYRSAIKKAWPSDSRLTGVRKVHRNDSIVLGQPHKIITNKEKRLLSCSELRQQHPGKHYSANFCLTPAKNQITSLNMITKRQDIMDKQYGVHHACPDDFQVEPRVPPMGRQSSKGNIILEDHMIKPTSVWYHIAKSRLIELKHRDKHNIVLRRFKASEARDQPRAVLEQRTLEQRQGF